MPRTKGSKDKRPRMRRTKAELYQVRREVMVDKYLVSDDGGKEVPVIRKESAVDSTPRPQNAPNTGEKAPTQPQAGDAAAANPTANFAGQEEAVVVEPVQKETFYCGNCRRHYSDEEVRKEAIDYARSEDGSLTKCASRFSVFCKVCARFLRIIDKDAAKMLNEMIRKNIKN